MRKRIIIAIMGTGLALGGAAAPVIATGATGAVHIVASAPETHYAG